MRPRYLRCRVLGPVHRLIRLDRRHGAARAGLKERVAAALSPRDQQVVRQRLAQLDGRSPSPRIAPAERRLNAELLFWDNLVEIFGADRSELAQVLPTRNKPAGLADDGARDAKFCVEIELSSGLQCKSRFHTGARPISVSITNGFIAVVSVHTSMAGTRSRK